MIDIDKLVRPNVLSLTPYSCARDEFTGKAEVFLDANENPYGYLNRYPDPYQRELKAEISRIKNIAVERIFLGNGSDEIIDLCFRIFCRPGIDKALTFSPTYGMYQVSASVNDVEIVKVPLDKNFQIDPDNTKELLNDKNLKLIFICSPNNPTGNCMDRSVIKEIISEFKGIVLIDEAYIDFAETGSMTGELDSYNNLIVMQTFSKAFGLAAARVGIAYTNPAIVRYLNKMKPPYNISTINQKVVLQKLKQLSTYKGQLRKIKNERARLSTELKKLPLIRHIYPSEANFLLVRFDDAGFIYKYLVDKGIIVRNRSSVIDNCIRITVGTKQENSELLKALNDIGSSFAGRPVPHQAGS